MLDNKNDIDWCAKIEEAHKRIKPHVLKTPLFHSTYLSAINGGEVYLKLESEQYTGSFKARGALNKVMSLTKEEKITGMVTASTGNHAQGFARALSITGDKGQIFLPTNADRSKVAALKYYDAELCFYGDNCLDTELHAMQHAKEMSMTWVSPYNDVGVIAGQGTIAKEITETLSEVDHLLGCIGGGGMMGGVSVWMKKHSPKTVITGCLPERSPEMYLSVKANKVIVLEDPQETLSDGSAGGLEKESITFPLCKKNIDQYILVAEEEIAAGIKFMADKHHKIVEGAAAVSIASFINNAERFKNKRVVIVICGANITTDKLKNIL